MNPPPYRAAPLFWLSSFLTNSHDPLGTRKGMPRFPSLPIIADVITFSGSCQMFIGAPSASCLALSCARFTASANPGAVSIFHSP